MADILPAAPLGGLSPETVRVFRLLSGLPDKAYYVWQRLGVSDVPGPDFWILDADRRALLIKVCGATPHQVKATLQPGLFGGAATVQQPGMAEETAISAFQSGLGAAAATIPAAVLFPNLSTRDLDRLADGNDGARFPWLGKPQLKRATFDAWLAENLGPPLDQEAISALRQAFTPEVVIPPKFTVRRIPGDRNTAAVLAPALLDYRQEKLLKTDLDLSEIAHDTARDFSIRLINGVAGSGKSLIVVYRVHLLRRHFPGSKILVLTHNRALIRDLRKRYALLSGGDSGVDWYTFQGWCRRHLPDGALPDHRINNSDREAILERICHEHLGDTTMTAALLREEIDWFKDRLLSDLESYLTADRTGRGYAMAESMRRRVYAAMAEYHRELQARNTADWGDVPRRLWALLESGQLRPTVYDVILIDEAQFFAPIWFEIVKKVLKPGRGHLFMVADPSQGFLKRRQSWIASGLEVRGRAHRLDRSYRTTREILNFATLLYRTRLPEDDESDEIVPPNLLDMPNGATPVIIPLYSPQDEATRVVNEIRMLLDEGVPLSDILIIHADGRQFMGFIDRLCREFGDGAAVDPGYADDSSQSIRVCPLGAATGLEAPIVFLMGVHYLYEMEQSVRLAEADRLELIRDNTRKLYMACTRAGQRLVLTYVGDIPSALTALIDEEHVLTTG